MISVSLCSIKSPDLVSRQVQVLKLQEKTNTKFRTAYDRQASMARRKYEEYLERSRRASGDGGGSEKNENAAGSEVARKSSMGCRG